MYYLHKIYMTILWHSNFINIRCLVDILNISKNWYPVSKKLSNAPQNGFTGKALCGDIYLRAR